MIIFGNSNCFVENQLWRDNYVYYEGGLTHLVKSFAKTLIE